MKYYSLSRPEVQTLVPDGINSMLDVGCGVGYFAKAIKDRLGCKTWGIEPNTEAASKASELLDHVIPGLYSEVFEHIDEKFELVCFNDVLEHMEDPWSALISTKEILEPDGMIMASLPNILHYHEFLEILLSKDWAYTDKGIMDKTHLRFFTKKSMIRMFEDCGYRVIAVDGIDPTPSKKMTLISILSLGYFSEMRFPQFVIKAKVK